jgi:Zn-dependent protease with chaperone function
MSPSVIGLLLVPFIGALAAGYGAAVAQRRLPPRAATWFLTVVAAAVGLAALSAIGLVGFGYLAQRPLDGFLGWCHETYAAHDGVPAPLGIVALAMTAFMAFRVWRVRRHRAHLLALIGPEPVEIVASPAPIAYAVPGRPGQIVVSTGMLRALDADELKVLFAHEDAHLEHRHYRFLSIVELVAAAVPMLRPLLRQLQFVTERWADEDAAEVVGDRELVARAIARAALATFDHANAPVLSLTGSGVPARVEALRAEPPQWHGRAKVGLAAVVAFVVVGLAASTLQLHHLVRFAIHICT